jgi:protein phosphatase 4 regulatory subunit 3
LADTPCHLDDGLSDEALEGMHAVMLPQPELDNLTEIEGMMRMANNSAMGRDALTKFVLSAEYVAKLVPLVKMAEDNEDVTSLHKLCNIMKTLILLNDTAIIETVVMDELILGVVGALECRLTIELRHSKMS